MRVISQSCLRNASRFLLCSGFYKFVNQVIEKEEEKCEGKLRGAANGVRREG